MKYREAMGICHSWHLTINNKDYLCTVDCNNTFPLVKHMEGFSTDNLMKTCNIIFPEYRLFSKTVFNVCLKFISERCKNFCKRFGIWHAISSSYNHQSKGQAEACVKFMENNEKCYKTNSDIYVLFITDKSNTNKPQTKKSSHTHIQQTVKMPIAKI